jgi:hypothetical protein
MQDHFAEVRGWRTISMLAASLVTLLRSPSRYRVAYCMTYRRTSSSKEPIYGTGSGPRERSSARQLSSSKVDYESSP